MKTPSEWIVVILLCTPAVTAGFVSWAIATNIDKISVDGWKRLYALNKALVNFYITVFITAIIGARYIEILGDQMFTGLLVASATALGIKIGVDIRKNEDK